MLSLSRPAEATFGSPSSRQSTAPNAGLPIGPRLLRRSSRNSSVKFSLCPSSHQPQHNSASPAVVGRPAAAISTSSEDDFAERYDMNFWHYQPWWWQPHTILLAGCSIIAAVSLQAQDHLRAALYTSVPVAAWCYVFLRVLPCQFRSKAVRYLETHDPEDL